MVNTKTNNVVKIMGLEKRFLAGVTLQLDLVSNNPEIIYEAVINGFDLDAIEMINEDTEKIIRFEVEWAELQSAVLFSDPDEEEMYIDLMRCNEKKFDYFVTSIEKSEFSILTNNGRKELFKFKQYQLIESLHKGNKRYFFVNSETGKVYEILLESCFNLLTIYLDEMSEAYILANEFARLETLAN